MIELMIYLTAFIAMLVALTVAANRIEHHFYLRETVASIQYALKHKNADWEEELLP
ncbi:hypothetical protein [Thiospirillum jenense]|uniref:Uncharacterized protein n=1 Tax=Thiospirillum jenense TaxID=1653858 RepID=A0A839HBB4_9GAMM|nr:hypothetical protein [Thiospirillum jenense]MBB1125500.1 hypothetical protein [Thiospirillum jenense]